MDRLEEMNKIYERLDGETIFKKKVWIIMDHARKIICKGAPHTMRYLVLLSDIKDRKRVLVYNSEKAARSAMVSWCMLETGVKDYIDKTYGADTKLVTCLDVVEATNIIKI